MAISGYIGWSSRCNQVILDSTSITLGENSTKTDELESGLKRTRLRSGFNPEKYQVVMEFEWYENVLIENTDGTYTDTGKSEIQYFYEWYKYSHKYGTVPFEFPKILYSPNTGIKVYDEAIGHYETEFYKITSAVEGAKSGTKIQVKMTWETVYGGAITIEEQSLTFQSMDVHNGYCDFVFSAIGSTIPVSSDFKLYIDDTQVSTTGLFYDKGYVIRLFFNPKLDSAIHTFTFSLNNSQLTIAKNVYTAQFQSEE